MIEDDLTIYLTLIEQFLTFFILSEFISIRFFIFLFFFLVLIQIAFFSIQSVSFFEHLSLRD